MDTYARAKAHLAQQLQSRFAYEESGLPEFQPGPPGADHAADTLGACVVLTSFAGPGLALEGLLDRIGWGVDVAGDQGDYESCELLAKQVDLIFLALERDQVVQGIKVQGAQRAGGRPQVTGVDDGDRWHASCSYVVTVQSGVYA